MDNFRTLEKKADLEETVENFPDAIVSFDLDGIVTSWNKAAEKMYGFSKEESIGRFLPFTPRYLINIEKQNIERIKNGEFLRDYETIRQRKDGTTIDVSLSVSPVRDQNENIIGGICISRDISEKKRFQKELIRRNQELSRLFFISSAMRGTLELERLLRMILTAVTMSDGLGFNRAILFLVDENRGILKGAMGVGPSSPEEAGKIWRDLSLEKKTLSDIIYEIETGALKKDSLLDRLSLSLEIPLSEDTILTRAVKEKKPFNIFNVKEEPLSDSVLIEQLETEAYAVAPLVSRDKVIGVIWVDNHFNKIPILEEDMTFLSAFSNHVASAVENTRLFEQVSQAEQELENIFESISDKIFFTTKDYIIKKVNKAVCEKLGMTPAEIIGKRCFEVFHGRTEPRKRCPHHKTIETKMAYIEELEEPYLGGTFITSSSPIFDNNGEFIGTVNVMRDITEIKKLREELILAQRMAALGEVAARVAHDIRNPLVSIGGFARRLERNLKGPLKEYAEIIVKEITGLEVILMEILSYIRGVSLERQMVSVDSLVEEITTTVKSELEEREITLVKEFNSPFQVFMDAGNIREALLNIITNAIHAIGKKGKIIIRTYKEKDFVAIEIKDTGIGIPEEALPFIFDPFFTTKGSGSTGLGLTITHKIIEKHKGRIEVESKPNTGSTFRVLLPLKNGG
ncbi:MAG: PAS domain S-box protein [Nitrospirae bacterium]|nr:PAS domain S-box protein [Nitrospirota bacterium]